ncbi:MAG: hypothetical protein ACR2OS_05315 [Paracoccaceae bacterium]
MRLYQDSKGQWYGTQADARRAAPRDWREVEVPTSKQELINWLSVHEVGAKVKGLSPEPQEPKPELLAPQAASWVSWALETLNRGHKSDAAEMLRKGLKIQKGWAQ